MKLFGFSVNLSFFDWFLSFTLDVINIIKLIQFYFLSVGSLQIILKDYRFWQQAFIMAENIR